LRWISVAAGLLLAALVVAMSAYGRGLKQFVLDARVELRKIVWPTRQETLQVTLAVFIFVIVAGVFFLAGRSRSAWATSSLSGQGA
jgi:preprotein translocase subunit SecE